MADRFDGRLAVRPASDRSLSEMNQPEKSNVGSLVRARTHRVGQGREQRSSGSAATGHGAAHPRRLPVRTCWAISKRN